MQNGNCTICERRCRLTEGETGACGLYALTGGHIVERHPNRFLVACPISIETMPIFHYHPGAKFFQISTTGCNFNCPGCISTVLVREMAPDSSALKHLTPDQIVARAIENDCAGIVFLMNDPLAAFPTFLDIAERAHAKGLNVGCSSNAYFSPESLERLLPLLDFINIGMKGFTDAAYRKCGAQGIAPLLRNLSTLHEAGIHTEVSCILTRDNGPELMALARHLRSLSPHIPLQVMRFLPFEAAAIDKEPTVREAEDFCRTLQQVLDYVYLFNTPGSDYLHTRCPLCGHVVLQREFYGPMGAKLKIAGSDLPPDSHCPICAHPLPVVGSPSLIEYREGDFEGGYPLTRAMEMVEAMLIAMGVAQPQKVVQAWEDLLQDGGLSRLHQRIQQPHTYIEMVRELGRKADAAKGAQDLADYLANHLKRLETVLARAVRHPTVYYAMGKPLFYINAGRMENRLVELAGGISLNQQLPAGGRPGHNLSVAQLNALNPEVIFISAFLSNRVEDFYDECRSLEVTVDAVKYRRIFIHPAPGWDFGSPRWVLGLLFMAGVLHPNLCTTDIMAEAQYFYRRFYKTDFSLADVNRSFAKPTDKWRWSA